MTYHEPPVPSSGSEGPEDQLHEAPGEERSTSVRTRFRVAEGSCVDCAGDLRSSLRRLPGVRAVEILGAVGVVVVDHDHEVSVQELQRQAARCGLRLVPAEGREPEGVRPWWRRARFVALALAVASLGAGLVAHRVLSAERAGLALYLTTVAVGGFHPLRSALEMLRRGRLTIGTLLVVATAGALALGIVEEAALLVVVFSLGEVLEDYVADRARGSIRALMALAPPVAARRHPAGRLESVPVEALRPGDLIVVRPGQRLPTDGEVVAGRSFVDQSPVTGESMPVEVGPGSHVFGGTVNGTGALEIRVTKEHADTVLAGSSDRWRRPRQIAGEPSDSPTGSVPCTRRRCSCSPPWWPCCPPSSSATSGSGSTGVWWSSPCRAPAPW
jgi:Cd2+/Zn2+-exporting ATPase